ncbi:uncharacterized protein LOC126381144 [Pectinophora gossypiella]|uniref:uncharacterized protein LOC126381144 n=1 Tax=Pectinophora gossypiella TaxID=13191 RepID=UPI00214ECD85|nr:uncharacterized protein LOC126381144 [Pectinophora gossypiella]
MMKMTMSLQCKQYSGKRKVSFVTGELVLVQIINKQKKQWTKGQILKKLGSSVYLVRVLGNNQEIKKHSNQLLKYKGEKEYVEEKDEGSDEQEGTETEELAMPPIVWLPSTGTSQAPQQAAASPSFSISGEEEHTVTPASAQTGGNEDSVSDQWAECETSQPEQLPSVPNEPRTDEPTSGVLSPREEPQAATTVPKRNRKVVDYRKFF